MKRYRFEIISNQSVEEDIVDTLEEAIPQLEYTIIPTVHGKGLKAKKLGTTTWPEQNFLMFCYVDHENAVKIKEILEKIVIKFPIEGISFFCVEEAEL